jgi:hypothetical protein
LTLEPRQYTVEGTQQTGRAILAARGPSPPPREPVAELGRSALLLVYLDHATEERSRPMKMLRRLGVVLCAVIVLPLGTTGCSTKEKGKETTEARKSDHDGGGKPAKDPAKRIVGSWEMVGDEKASFVFTSDGEYRLIDNRGNVDKKGRFRFLTEAELEIAEERETPIVLTIEFRSDDEIHLKKRGDKKTTVMKRRK